MTLEQVRNLLVGCQGCQGWLITQPRRQYGRQRASACDIWGVSRLSRLFQYLSRTRVRVCDAHLTHNGCRITLDSLDTPCSPADSGSLRASTSVRGVKGAGKFSLDTLDTPGGGYIAS